MNRETIVEHVKPRDEVIVWTASDLYYRYWVYRYFIFGRPLCGEDG